MKLTLLKIVISIVIGLLLAQFHAINYVGLAGYLLGMIHSGILYGLLPALIKHNDDRKV